MKAAHEISASAIGTDVVQVVAPSASEQTVSSRNMATGRRLFAAYLSAAQPQKK